MLKNMADIRSIIFMILAGLVLVVLWRWGFEFSAPLFVGVYIMQLLLAVIVAVMVHNHQHVRMWKNKWLNIFTDHWLTVFYGFPIFAWVPTHNANHHVHVNKQPDYTRTYRFTEKNNLFTLLTYPSISGFFQQKVIGMYLGDLWRRNRKAFAFCAFQIASVVIWTVAALLIDWQKALLFVVIPQQVSLYSVLVFNYVQHVHADEESDYNHSRNITGPVLNFLLLNNGYHTAHHLAPAVHWSKLAEQHQKIAEHIDPSLNERSFFWFLFRTYVLSMFVPSLRSHSMRVERLNKSTAPTT